MKVQNVFSINRASNKYDAAIRAFYLVFYAAGAIIFIVTGLNSTDIRTWILAFFGAAFGATAYGTIAKMIVNMVRKDRQKSRADTLLQLIFVVFFSLATVAFMAIGLEHGNIKTWAIAFVGAYGAATVYSAIAYLIVGLVRKDKNRQEAK